MTSFSVLELKNSMRKETELYFKYASEQRHSYPERWRVTLVKSNVQTMREMIVQSLTVPMKNFELFLVDYDYMKIVNQEIADQVW